MKNPRAFSLIELMVVIAIVSMLVSLLLPAVSQAHDVSLQIRCAAQLRQHGVAHCAYQTDHQNYFPSFSGPVVNDYSNWYRTNGNSNGRLWDMGNLNSAATTYFGDYMNQGTPATYKLQAANFCPTINWQYLSTRTPFANGGILAGFLNPSPGGEIGYNFYTGQKFFASSAYDFDTRPRRENPKELLATDLLVHLNDSGNTGSIVYNGQTYTNSINYPWFNPHNGNAATALCDRGFNQLCAGGSVAKSPATTIPVITTYYSSAHCACVADVNAIAPANINSMENGTYWTVK